MSRTQPTINVMSNDLKEEADKHDWTGIELLQTD